MNPDEVTKRNPDVYVRVFCFRLCRQFIGVSNWKQKTQPLRSKARVSMLVMNTTRGSEILTRSQQKEKHCGSDAFLFSSFPFCFSFCPAFSKMFFLFALSTHAHSVFRAFLELSLRVRVKRQFECGWAMFIFLFCQEF